jgi:lipid A 3-O-deacylase
MKLHYVLLLLGLLFLGCSRHPINFVAPDKTKINQTSKPVEDYTPRLAKEFQIQSDFVTGQLSVKDSLPEETPRISADYANLKRRKIILELAEGMENNRQIALENNPSFIVLRLKAERRFSLTFENDIFDMTDRYYTNGVKFEWTSQILTHSPMSRLMFAYNHPATIAYAVYLMQNMYTPISTKIPPALSGNDRPYSAYMILGHRKEITDAKRKLKVINDITLGVIGAYSLGSLMQQGVHHSLPTNDPPLGWETQINNDLVVGYHLQIDKALVTGNNWQLGALAAAEAGTLYDNFMTGFRLETGKDVFSRVKIPKRQKQKVEFQAYLQGEGRLIGYDATLQGGMFNHDNLYTLHANQIEHFVLKTEAGVSVRFLQYGLELGQTLITPEYSGGKIHKWGRVTLNFYFR